MGIILISCEEEKKEVNYTFPIKDATNVKASSVFQTSLGRMSGEDYIRSLGAMIYHSNANIAGVYFVLHIDSPKITIA